MKILPQFSLSKKALATLLPLLVAGQVSAAGVATVYKDCNYGGYAVDLNVGDYTLAQLQALGVADNDISALKVAPGYEVQLFDGDRFLNEPTSLTVSGEVSCLVDRGFNDKTSSLRVRTVGPATAFKDCNGAGLALPAKGDYTTNQLLALGIANNDLSGLKVNSGFEVQLFDGDNLLGTASPVFSVAAGNSRTSCLVASNFNDKTSSIRVRLAATAAAAKANATKDKLAERAAAASRSVYPNPVSAGGRLTVDLGALSEQADLELTDLRGARLAAYSFQNVRTAELTLPAAASGMVLLKVSTATKTSTQKVVVE